MLNLAVIAFPGNNCETESLRAAQRNGFKAELVRWNQPDKIGSFDAYFLCGGFSFEDRGRSGALAARDPIFDKLRQEAKTGKIILGICNGAQMIVESGLIPVGDNALPFSLAHNIRRNQSGQVMGTGFYNTWSHIIPERTDTAFTNKSSQPLAIPIAHGEGRFTSQDPKAQEALNSGSHVAFRYGDKAGTISEDYPITPNGAEFSTAAIVNAEGTIMAIMPHPERFWKNCDGDQIFQSMHTWIEDKKSPDQVKIGDLSKTNTKPKLLPRNPEALYLEKKLLITDNEAFSVSQVASHITGEEINFSKSKLYEISGENLDAEKIKNSGLIFNPNKEQLIENMTPNKYYSLPFQDDEADDLAEKLSALLGSEIHVKIYTGWDFNQPSEAARKAILNNSLLSNPNATQLFTT